jgi:hypothetical protein
MIADMMLRYFSRSISLLAKDIKSVWPIFIPLVVMLPGITQFPYPNQTAEFSDLAISHYPNAFYLKSAIKQFGVIPLWSPTILSGYPFFGNPLAGFWYPLGWLALVFPLPLGFNVMIILHLLIGGIGMYKLLSQEGVNRSGALFGGIAFAALPKLYAHYGAGHLTLLYAIPLTPWLLYTSIRKNNPVHRQFSQRLFSRLTPLPAVVLALIILADVRWSVYAAILWGMYVITKPTLLPPHLKFRSTSQKIKVITRLRLLDFLTLFFQTVLAIMLAAPLLFPLLEYVHFSTRAALSSADFFQYSLPVERLLGLFYPDFAGFHEYILYPGIIVILLALPALIWKQVRFRKLFWGMTALLTLIFAMGSTFPFLEFVAGIPFIGLLRVPSRALFLTGMALCMLASYGVHHIVKGVSEEERRHADLGLTALVVFMVLIAGAVWIMTSKLPLNFAWGAGLAFVGSRWIGAKFWGRMSFKFWFSFLIFIALIDWLGVNYMSFTPRSRDQVLSEQENVALKITERDIESRVYSPSYSIPQQTAAIHGIQLADGVDPLQLESYANFMEKATGVRRNGYSVTMPAFDDGDPDSANRNSVPDAELLGLLNVGWVAAEYELISEGLVLRDRIGDTRLYENLLARPRVWLESVDPGTDEIGRILHYVWEPNQIRITTSGPGLLVLSEIAYPGWRVMVDKTSTSLYVYRQLLRAVELAEGSHEVKFVFRPISLYIGLLVSIIGLVSLFGLTRYRNRAATEVKVG